MFVGKT